MTRSELARLLKDAYLAGVSHGMTTAAMPGVRESGHALKAAEKWAEAHLPEARSQRRAA